MVWKKKPIERIEPSFSPGYPVSRPSNAELSRPEPPRDMAPRNLAALGLEVCPHCRNAIPITSVECPECGGELYASSIAPKSAVREYTAAQKRRSLRNYTFWACVCLALAIGYGFLNSRPPGQGTSSGDLETTAATDSLEERLLSSLPKATRSPSQNLGGQVAGISDRLNAASATMGVNFNYRLAKCEADVRAVCIVIGRRDIGGMAIGQSETGPVEEYYIIQAKKDVTPQTTHDVRIAYGIAVAAFSTQLSADQRGAIVLSLLRRAETEEAPTIATGGVEYSLRNTDVGTMFAVEPHSGIR